jgi:hypothetical protein
MSTQPDQPRTPAAGPEPALVLVRDRKAQAPAVRASSSVAVLDQNAVDRIKFLEAEAKALIRQASEKREEAEDIRKQAAQLIVKLLHAGASQRDVASAIGRSHSHVSFASTAWFILQDETLNVTSFNKAYKMAQHKVDGAAAIEAQRGPEAIESPAAADAARAPARNGSAAAERPFPPWKKQMDVLGPLLPEMVEQADLRQARSLFRVLERLARDLHAKIKDLESVPGHA